MDLRVSSADLEGFARLVRRAADDVAEARAYTAKYGAVDVAEQGLLTRIITLHGDLEGVVTESLGRLQAILAGSAGELHKAAGYYRATDLARAAELDAVYPEVRR